MLRYGSALSVAPPKQSNPNPMPIGDGFRFVVYLNVHQR